MHDRPTAQVPQLPPHPSDPHSRPEHRRVQTHCPVDEHVEPAAQVPQLWPAQFCPGSGPHCRPLHIERQVWSGDTQRPTALQAHPARGHVPQLPPAPSGPHSRPMQFLVAGTSAVPASRVGQTQRSYPLPSLKQVWVPVDPPEQAQPMVIPGVHAVVGTQAPTLSSHDNPAPQLPQRPPLSHPSRPQVRPTQLGVQPLGQKQPE